ncbi:MAG: BrnA antitoxin family protein [SAR202 cluster bacterium]|jgi:uncharacterized protein (DUF4415 family)|nr:BrnA antitoxin family protein [SAR202 cluster bacterium]|tara:strand:- start:111 stop:431 length:321 start_codon:yes stop_codon:yes gene_type:complete
MSEKRIVRARKTGKGKELKTDWEKLDAMTEEEIERNARSDLDSILLEDCDLTKMRVIMPQRKRKISLRVDGDVLNWYQSFGRGYQTRMNAILRAYMEASIKAQETE